MSIILIHSDTLSFEQSKAIERTYGKPFPFKNHYRLNTTSTPSQNGLKTLSDTIQIDINLIPEDFNPHDVRLVISDMDSTLISIECIDEIADYLNIKPEIAAITKAAMLGELDFKSSLIKRVALLAGLETHALQNVFDKHLTLNPGAKTWLAGLKDSKINFALVSGGFTFFTDRLKVQLDLDFTRANILEENDGKLTGIIKGRIIGAQAKADFLHELCKELNIKPNQVISVGDGANDLLMMKEAGLSIAYHAKPTVQKQANSTLNYCGLDAILDFIA